MTNPTVPELALGWRMLLARAAILAVAWPTAVAVGPPQVRAQCPQTPAAGGRVGEAIQIVEPGAGICGTRHSCGAGD